MVVTWRDGGLWILPESPEEHSALMTLHTGLRGVLGIYRNRDGKLVTRNPQGEEREIDRQTIA
jgi:hypothetical protein